VVAKGAFEATLKDWADSASTLPVLFGHRMDDPDYNIGGVLEASEDEHGLLVKAQLDMDSPKAQQVYRLLKGRRINQMSFAYDVLNSAEVEEDGRKVNELRELKLYEVSVVALGANQDTEVLDVKTAAGALVERVKAGRVLSGKNEKALTSAVDKIQSAADEIESILATVRGGDGEENQGEASGQAGAKDEEPKGVQLGTARLEIHPAKSEGDDVNPSARAVAELELIALQ
jgi:HK97 family phage prohead protease